MAISIKNIKLATKSGVINYPQLPGFKVTLGYISNELTRSLLEQSAVVKIDESTGVSYEDTDNVKFAKLFCKHAILGWEGLTISSLSTILLINANPDEKDEEVEFSEDNAYELYMGCTAFNKWVTTSVKTLSQFR